jgi:hypothetical protein
MVTVYPNDLLKWVDEEAGEVLKIEKKIAALLADPRGTSVSLKPLPKPTRRLVHGLVELYGLKAVSEDDNDPRGKVMRIVKQPGASQPLPLLSGAIAFERRNPSAVASARFSAEETAAAAASAAAAAAASASAFSNNEGFVVSPDKAEAAWLLLSGVPDLLESAEVRALVNESCASLSSSSSSPSESLSVVVDLWPQPLPGQRLEDGVAFGLAFRHSSAAAKVHGLLAELIAKRLLPFEASRWPSALRHVARPVVRPSSLLFDTDSWGMDADSAEGGGGGGGGSATSSHGAEGGGERGKGGSVSRGNGDDSADLDDKWASVFPKQKQERVPAVQVAAAAAETEGEGMQAAVATGVVMPEATPPPAALTEEETKDGGEKTEDTTEDWELLADDLTDDAAGTTTTAAAAAAAKE